MASDAPEGGASNAALLDVSIEWPFKFRLRVNDPATVISLSSKVATALGLALGSVGIGIGALCYKHPEFVIRIVEKALTAPGRQVGSVTPGSILVELHCYTEESFRSFMEDFEARKVQERLNKEFENSGYIGEELEVTITNYKEAYKFLEQISRQPESIKRDIRKREVSDDRDPIVAGSKATVERYFSEAISSSTAAKRKGELLPTGSGFESFGLSYGAAMGAPRELEGSVPKRAKSSASSEAGQSVATTSRTADGEHGEHGAGRKRSGSEPPSKGEKTPVSGDEVKVGCPSEDELEELSIMLSDNWGKFGRRLGFAQARITAFHKENEKLSDKAYAMLMEWKEREGSDGTYKVLYDALCHKLVNCKRIAEKICCV